MLFIGLLFITKWQIIDKNKLEKLNPINISQNFLIIMLIFNGINVLYNVFVDWIKIYYKLIFSSVKY
jgi:hypothetical protein